MSVQQAPQQHHQEATEIPLAVGPRRRPPGKVGFVLWGMVLVAVMSLGAAAGFGFRSDPSHLVVTSAALRQTQVSIQVQQNVPYTVLVTNEEGGSVGLFNGSETFAVGPGEYKVEIIPSGPRYKKRTEMMRFDGESIVGIPINLEEVGQHP